MEYVLMIPQEQVEIMREGLDLIIKELEMADFESGAALVDDIRDTLNRCVVCTTY